MDDIRYEFYATYIPSEDITVVWQNLYVKEDCIQRSLVSFYYGEPDDATTKSYSQMPLTAQFF